MVQELYSDAFLNQTKENLGIEENTNTENAAVTQGQSTSLVRKKSRVQIPSAAPLGKLHV